MLCPECGSDIDESRGYCARCGRLASVDSTGPLQLTGALAIDDAEPPGVGLVFAEQDADTKACPYCAEPVRVAAKVCKHCGREFQPERRTPPAPEKACPFCAEPIRVEAVVCKHCGRDLVVAPTVARPRAPRRVRRHIMRRGEAERVHAGDAAGGCLFASIFLAIGSPLWALFWAVEGATPRKPIRRGPIERGFWRALGCLTIVVIAGFAFYVYRGVQKQAKRASQGEPPPPYAESLAEQVRRGHGAPSANLDNDANRSVTNHAPENRAPVPSATENRPAPSAPEAVELSFQARRTLLRRAREAQSRHFGGSMVGVEAVVTLGHVRVVFKMRPDWIPERRWPTLARQCFEFITDRDGKCDSVLLQHPDDATRNVVYPYR